MSHPNQINQKNLLLATILNLVISVAEIIGGLISNSLALISDAVHNLGDTFAVFLAYVSHRIGGREPDQKRTFGYKRVEILAALFNALILVAISVFLVYESYHRFIDPQPVKGLIMFVVALVGLVANILAVFLLKHDSGKSINVRAAYIHLIGDTLSSVAVIIGSILIFLFDIHWIDPLVTVLIALYILKHAYRILKETIDILMQVSPGNIDLQAIKNDIEQLAEIENIHHVHVWSLTDQLTHFEAHVGLKDNITISKTGRIKDNIEDILKNKYHIHHITIQFEYNECHDKGLIHNSK